MTGVKKRLKLTMILRLTFAGWHRNRSMWGRLGLPASFDVFPEAKRILDSFGGLNFGNRNEYARIDPSSGDEALSQIRECERKLSRRLYPVGYREHEDREYFLVDETGIVYLLIGDMLHPLASSFEKALDYIVRGTIRRRDLNKDLGMVGMAGKQWRLDESGYQLD